MRARLLLLSPTETLCFSADGVVDGLHRKKKKNVCPFFVFEVQYCIGKERRVGSISTSRWIIPIFLKSRASLEAFRMLQGSKSPRMIRGTLQSPTSQTETLVGNACDAFLFLISISTILFSRWLDSKASDKLGCNKGCSFFAHWNGKSCEGVQALEGEKQEII